MSEETNSNSDYEPTSAPFGSYQWGQNQREKLQLYEQQSNASYQPPRFHFQSQMMPGFQQTTTTRIVPTNYQERKEHFRMEFLTDSNNSKKASHNAPKLALTTLSTDTQLEEFLTFWAAFEDSVERTNKSWTEKLFLLHQYLDADLRKTFSSFEIAKARNLIGPEKELEFFNIYMSCKAVLFERVQDDTYSTIDRAIANLPKLSRASTTFQLYEYQDVLTKLQRGGLTNGQTITHKIWIMITKWILSWCVFFITKNVMVFESRFLFAQLESNAFVLLTIWTQTNEYLTFITSPSPTVYTVLWNRCVTYKLQTFLNQYTIGCRRRNNWK